MLIDHRRTVQAKQKSAKDEKASALNAEQLGLKILANSTSYGIFVELNVETLDRAKPATLYDFRGIGRKVKAKKVEKPGRYFHPLLGAVITSAARLMLALTERNALDQGLGWAFCDTDSLAIANPQRFAEPEFIERVEAVLRYFEPLNPYEKKGSILQLEKVDFPPGHDGDRGYLRPVNCLAISAKRYVLFDRDGGSKPVIRKGSAHGLGHLLAPYTESPTERATRLREVNLELWEEDLWLAIIAADDAGESDLVDFASLRNFDEPAVSRYAATNQTLLKWFDGYNDGLARAVQVWPFNFLLTYQAKSAAEMAAVDPVALDLPVWRRRVPQPVSRYSSNPIAESPNVFDRSTRDPIQRAWLKTYHRSLVRHHLHAETKFRGGSDTERGILERRQVQALAFLAIGKEADNLDERVVLGEDDEPIEWELDSVDFRAMLAELADVQALVDISDRRLCEAAKVSPHTLRAMRRGNRLFPESLIELTGAAERLRCDRLNEVATRSATIDLLRQNIRARGDLTRIAHLMGVSGSYLGRVLRGEKVLTIRLTEKLTGILQAR